MMICGMTAVSSREGAYRRYPFASAAKKIREALISGYQVKVKVYKFTSNMFTTAEILL